MFGDITPLILLEIALIGLAAGTLGGLLGVGGSTIMIPTLTICLGPNQHLYQAAAMLANVAVAIPAALRHRKAGAVAPDALVYMLPAAVVCVILGVAASNLAVFRGPEAGERLGYILAAFMVYVIYANAKKLRRELRDAKMAKCNDMPAPPAEDPTKTRKAKSPARGLTVGTSMGFIAGLLGIGGGALAVPLQQVLLKLPLRNCIANSSVVICVSAAIGATYKIATLSQHATPEHPLTWAAGVTLGCFLAPTAWLGGRLGASLTHRLPVRQVRIVFILLMAVAAWKMAGLPTGI